MEQVTVRKLDHTGQRLAEYPGWVLRRDDDVLVLSTAWDRDPLDLGFVVLEPGDRWTEYFYAGRWYNIFEIRARDLRLKGWYCNVTRPALIHKSEVSAEDLALDLWVEPSGETHVLDEDDFAGLHLSTTERQAAQMALAELRAMVAANAAPFNRVHDGV